MYRHVYPTRYKDSQDMLAHMTSRTKTRLERTDNSTVGKNNRVPSNTPIVIKAKRKKDRGHKKKSALASISRGPKLSAGVAAALLESELESIQARKKKPARNKRRKQGRRQKSPQVLDQYDFASIQEMHEMSTDGGRKSH